MRQNVPARCESPAAEPVATARIRLRFWSGPFRAWYGWSDSNRHSLRKQILSLPRLPFRHTRKLGPLLVAIRLKGIEGAN